jgi:hypothetical protein
MTKNAEPYAEPRFLPESDLNCRVTVRYLPRIIVMFCERCCRAVTWIQIYVGDMNN